MTGPGQPRTCSHPINTHIFEARKNFFIMYSLFFILHPAQAAIICAYSVVYVPSVYFIKTQFVLCMIGIILFTK